MLSNPFEKLIQHCSGPYLADVARPVLALASRKRGRVLHSRIGSVKQSTQRCFPAHCCSKPSITTWARQPCPIRPRPCRWIEWSSVPGSRLRQKADPAAQAHNDGMANVTTRERIRNQGAWERLSTCASGARGSRLPANQTVDSYSFARFGSFSVLCFPTLHRILLCAALAACVRVSNVPWSVR